MRGEIKQSGAVQLRFWDVVESRAELMSLCLERGMFCEHVVSVKSDKRACEMLAVLLLIYDFDKDWELAHDENGAPFIKNNVGTFISITHSGNIVCVATSPLPFGIDIELNTTKILRVREKFLNEYELNFFSSEDMISNLMAWTAKEAIYKAYSTRGLDLRNDIRLAQDVRSGCVSRGREIVVYDITRLWVNECIVTIAVLKMM